MKTHQYLGSSIKQHNGSGYALAKAMPRRRFHNNVVYDVRFNGVCPDASNLVSITRARKQP